MVASLIGVSVEGGNKPTLFPHQCKDDKRAKKGKLEPLKAAKGQN